MRTRCGMHNWQARIFCHPQRRGSVVILDCHFFVEALASLTMVIKSGEQSTPYSTWLAIFATNWEDQNEKIGYRISTDAVSPTGHLNTQWHCDLPSMVGALVSRWPDLRSGHLRSVTLDIQKVVMQILATSVYTDAYTNMYVHIVLIYVCVCGCVI